MFVRLLALLLSLVACKTSQPASEAKVIVASDNKYKFVIEGNTRVLNKRLKGFSRWIDTVIRITDKVWFGPSYYGNSFEIYYCDNISGNEDVEKCKKDSKNKNTFKKLYVRDAIEHLKTSIREVKQDLTENMGNLVKQRDDDIKKLLLQIKKQEAIIAKGDLEQAVEKRFQELQERYDLFVGMVNVLKQETELQRATIESATAYSGRDSRDAVQKVLDVTQQNFDDNSEEIALLEEQIAAIKQNLERDKSTESEEIQSDTAAYLQKRQDEVTQLTERINRVHLLWQERSRDKQQDLNAKVAYLLEGYSVIDRMFKETIRGVNHYTPEQFLKTFKQTQDLFYPTVLTLARKAVDL